MDVQLIKKKKRVRAAKKMVAIIILNKMMMQEEEVSLQVKVGHFVVNYDTLTLFVSFYSTQQPVVKKKMVNHSP